MEKETKVGKITEKTKELFETNLVKALSDFVAIPNLSRYYDEEFHTNGHIEKAIEYCIDWANRQGVKGLSVKSVKAPGRETYMLFGVIEPTKKDFKNVAIYGHLDKQPHLTESWSEGLHPTKPVIKDGQLYGRGSTDDGYAFFTAVATAKISQECGIEHDRIVLFFETDEESASVDLEFYLDYFKEEIGQPDLFLVLDAAGPDYERFASTVSLRGIIEGEIKVSVLKQGLHSGIVGGIIPDSFTILRQIQNRLEDEKTGKVIEELNTTMPKDKYEFAQQYDKLLGQNEKKYPTVEGLNLLGSNNLENYVNSTWGASLTITGMEGFPDIKNAGNVIRPYTKLKFSLRAPPDLDVLKGNEIVKKILSENPPYNCKVEVEMDEPGQGFSAPEFEPKILEKMKETSQIFWKNDMALYGLGGSIPFVAMIGQRFPKTTLYVGGVGGPNDNIHGPDENIHLEFWEKFTCAITYFLSEL